MMTGATPTPGRSRRRWRTALQGLFGVVIVGTCVIAGLPEARASAAQPTYALTEEDRRLVDELQARAVLYFLDHTDPRTGLTRDRAANRSGPASPEASIAATGFALSAWCIADARGWLAPGEALRRTLVTLRFAANELEHEHGWYYHFSDATTGRRALASEVSTIDTALFLKGALFAREYLGHPEVTRLVDRIYRRLDWTWAQDGALTLSMGWRPETGFIEYRWDSYSELMGLYLLGIGAPVNPLPPEAWNAWRRPRATVAGRSYIHCGPLFTHQYAHAWFDFRGARDAHADYWQNSVDATLAQRAWSAGQRDRYPLWSAAMWGLTASDGPDGYMAWGTPGYGPDESDGTLVPCAPGGSLPFAPAECLAALHAMRAVGGDAVWGRYGFADAFNPHTGWVARDVIGIDVGITLMMAENLRTGLVWKYFMRAPEVRRGMALAGFKSSGTEVRLVVSAAATRVPHDRPSEEWVANPPTPALARKPIRLRKG